MPASNFSRAFSKGSSPDSSALTIFSKSLIAFSKLGLAFVAMEIISSFFLDSYAVNGNLKDQFTVSVRLIFFLSHGDR